MMINRQVQIHPTVEIPPWDPPYDDPTTDINLTNLIISPQTKAYFSALRQYLPSSSAAESDSVADSEADEFRMYEFKVRRCSRARSHDWTECPYAHPGEKARRRDPRRWNYSASPCPEFRRGGGCRKGESCEFAHGVFECWLHPARYRTQPCNDGPLCRRRVCFFAHTPAELRRAHHSPPPSESDSPPQSPSYGGNSVAELIGAMQGFHVGSPVGARIGGPGFGLPGRVGYFGVGRVDPDEEEVQMERVESGKGIRESMYAKLCKENSLDWGRVDSASSGPDFDFGWVSELVN